ncbi:EAL domain-containing protein [Neptunomonas antarctica]|nr:EAL domain-containing protein [Neptunomonas antarctica]
MCVALTAAYVYASYNHHQDFTTLSKHKRNSLEIYPVIFAEPLWNFNQPLIRNIAQSLLLDTDIIKVEVFDEGMHNLINLSSKNSASSDIAFIFEAPITYKNAHIQQLTGYLKVTVSNVSLQQDLTRALYENLVAMTVLFVMVFISIYSLFYRFISLPVSKLLLAINDNVEQHNFKQVQINDSSEIGDIITAFNHMQSTLERTYHDLKVSESRFRELYNNTPALMFLIDENCTILNASAYFCQHLGYDSADVIGKNISFFSSDPDAKTQCNTFKNTLQLTGNLQQRPFQLQNKQGRSLDTLLDAVSQDNSLCSLAVLTDVTKLKQAHTEIYYQASFDQLSGLPNRNSLLTHLNLLMNDDQIPFGLIFIDLDRFKAVNDIFGHTLGDQLIKVVGQRMSTLLRKSDLLARIGGDEFAIVTTADTGKLQFICQRILGALNQPFHLAESKINVSASFGIAIYPNNASTPEQLIQKADRAMYRAKEDGRQRYNFYTPDQEAHFIEQTSIELLLQNCLDDNLLVIYYQPIICLKTGKIIGTEALLRMIDYDNNLISPDQFISLAEETGAIVNIGNWCIHNACKQLAQWRETINRDMVLSINVSSRQLQSIHFLKQLNDSIAAWDIDPSKLIIEITESLLMHDNHTNKEVLQSIDKLGCKIAIDDFGTGFSSLSYLMKFPIKILKIDRSFIRDCQTNPANKALIGGILSLSQNLSLEVIAEGIETTDQFDFILQSNCELAQGFLFSKPMDADLLTSRWEELEQACITEFMQSEHAYP